MELEVFFAHTFAPKVLFGRAENTRRLYRHTMRAFARYLQRSPFVNDLSDETVMAYMTHLAHVRRLSPHSVNKDRSQLLAMANYAAKKRLIPEFLTVPLWPCPEQTPVAWKLGQLRQLIRTCRSQPGLIDGVPSGQWWEALHLVFFDTGERTEATLEIRADWFDTQTGWLRIPADARKGGKKARAYRLRPRTMKAVIAIMLPGRNKLFEFGGCIGTFYHRYTKLLKSAGLPSGRKWKPQCLRRSHASYLEAAGGNATESLGHSSRRTTKRSYLDPTIVGGKAFSSYLPKV